MSAASWLLLALMLPISQSMADPPTGKETFQQQLDRIFGRSDPRSGGATCVPALGTVPLPRSPLEDLLAVLNHSEPEEGWPKSGLECSMPNESARSVVFSAGTPASKAHQGFFATPECASFRAPGGRCGALAQTIFNELYGTYFQKYAGGDRAEAMKRIPFFSNSIPDLIEVCPNWVTFDLKKRIQFWTWLIGAMSYGESSCGSDTAALHTYQPNGLLQLEGVASGRKGACEGLATPCLKWRGSGRNRRCVQWGEQNREHHLKCGLFILHDQLQGQLFDTAIGSDRSGRPRMDRRIFPTGKHLSYWDVLLRCGPGGEKARTYGDSCMTGTPAQPKNGPAAKTWGIASNFPGCR